LNSVANAKIRRAAGFQRLHFFPACGDDGQSVVAAL
jgi:predicted NodU family carbamoyl transferase